MLTGKLPQFQVKCSHRPATGAERMRDLRRRNPGYDRRQKAEYRARLAAYRAALEVKEAAARAEAMALMLARHAATTTLLLPAPAVRLALPAPVVDPTVAAIDALTARLRSANGEMVAARADVVGLAVR